MKLRLMVGATSLFVVLGFSAPAIAKGASSPGPNGHNNHGLCNAYFNGGSTGQAQKQAHGAAFVGLEAAAAAYDTQQDMNNPPESNNDPNGDSTNEEVADYCAANG